MRMQGDIKTLAISGSLHCASRWDRLITITLINLTHYGLIVP